MVLVLVLGVGACVWVFDSCESNSTQSDNSWFQDIGDWFQDIGKGISDWFKKTDDSPWYDVTWEDGMNPNEEKFWRYLYADAQSFAKGNHSDIYKNYVDIANSNTTPARIESAKYFVSIYNATTGEESFSKWIDTVISITEKTYGSDSKKMCDFLRTLVN